MENNNNNVLDIKYVENKIGYEFNNKQLLVQAFTRKSYSESHKKSLNNENLEFFGDKIIGYYATKYIMKRYGYIKAVDNIHIKEDNNFFGLEVYNSPKDLTNAIKNIVDNKYLAFRIEMMFLSRFLKVDEEIEKDSIKVKGDLFEAIVGAVAIDSNLNNEIIEKTVYKMLDLDFKMTYVEDIKRNDFRSAVNEWYQQLNHESVPYVINQLEDGSFVASATLKLELGNRTYKGQGHNGDEAKLSCAEVIYNKEVVKESVEELIIDLLKHANLGTEITLDNSISFVYYLNQINLLDTPYYEEPEVAELKDENGNPIWSSCCNILTMHEGEEFEATGYASKLKVAKKIASYLVLCKYFQIDPLYDEYGNKLDELCYYENNK